MSNDLARQCPIIPMSDMAAMATAFAKSGMFGAKTQEQALALLLLAQGEGMHPAIAMRDFDVIQGRPSKKAEAMLRSFLSAGGSVEWHTLTDECADATFSHPQGGKARISWDMARAKKAGVGGKDMYAKFPRQMLRSRVVSEGCRTVYPAATSGLYVPEEAAEIAPAAPQTTGTIPALKNITPKAPEPKQEPTTSKFLDPPAGLKNGMPNEPAAPRSLPQTVEGRPPETPAPKTTPPPSAGNEVRDFITGVSYREGEKGGKKWQLFFVESQSNGTFKTFDKKFAEAAKAAEEGSTEVKIGWKAGKKDGDKDIVTIETIPWTDASVDGTSKEVPSEQA